MKNSVLLTIIVVSLLWLGFHRPDIEKNKQVIIGKPNTFYKELNNDFQFAYIKNGELYFYSVKSGTKSLFTETRKIFNAVFYDNGNSMYYTVIGDNENLELVKADFTENTPVIKNIAVFNYPGSYFQTQTYFEKGRLAILNDTLYAECNYEWLSSLMSSIKYDIKNKTIIPTEEGNPIYDHEWDIYRSQEEKFFSMRNNIKVVVTKNIPDLYMTSGNKTIRLTNTTGFDRQTEDYSGDIRYEISPDSSKILFSFVTGVGDLEHGPYCAVNIDGTNQRLLVNDGLGADHFKPTWMPDGSSLLYMDDDKNLNLLSGSKNTITKIDTEVDYYLINH
jgi:hypothetical protein